MDRNCGIFSCKRSRQVNKTDLSISCWLELGALLFECFDKCATRLSAGDDVKIDKKKRHNVCSIARVARVFSSSRVNMPKAAFVITKSTIHFAFAINAIEWSYIIAVIEKKSHARTDIDIFWVYLFFPVVFFFSCFTRFQHIIRQILFDLLMLSHLHTVNNGCVCTVLSDAYARWKKVYFISRKPLVASASDDWDTATYFFDFSAPPFRWIQVFSMYILGAPTGILTVMHEPV